MISKFNNVTNNVQYTFTLHNTGNILLSSIILGFMNNTI